MPRMTTDAAVPQGFFPSDLDEGFLVHVGPLYMRRVRDDARLFVLALRAKARHANRYGVVHGGLLATLADTAIGANLARTGAGTQVDNTLTVNLSLDYIAGAQIGDWIEAHVRLTKAQGRVRFGQCDVLCGKKLLVRASASFYVPAPR